MILCLVQKFRETSTAWRAIAFCKNWCVMYNFTEHNNGSRFLQEYRELQCLHWYFWGFLLAVNGRRASDRNTCCVTLETPCIINIFHVNVCNEHRKNSKEKLKTEHLYFIPPKTELVIRLEVFFFLNLCWKKKNFGIVSYWQTLKFSIRASTFSIIPGFFAKVYSVIQNWKSFGQKV